MGQSSSRRRREEYHQTYPPHAPLPPPPPAPPHNPYHYSARPNFSNPYYNSPPPPAPYYYGYQPQQSSFYGGLTSFLESLVGNSFSSYYRPHQSNVWWTPAAPAPPLPANTDYYFYSAASSSTPVAGAAPPPPFVEHQNAKKVKNDVNVHKETIRLEVDESNPDHHLVSFVYDALVDGSITIYYFAKEGENCSFRTTIDDMCKPRTYPFEKGTAKKFLQPSGDGIDLGFFELDNLSKTGDREVFPLVIYAESCQPTQADDQASRVTRAQITLAVIEKNKEAFQVKVAKQILWIDGERYELWEIFGLSNSTNEPVVDGDDDGKECVICMTEPRDTAVFPCRHLCMCGNCAKALRLQSNKCPICRQPVEKLMEINVQSSDR